MRTLLPALLPVLAAALPGQTQGVTGVNDFWITPGGSPNQSSCAPLTVNTPTTVTFNVSTAPGTLHVFVWSFCGCMPCAPIPAMGTSSCLPPPTSACPTSNQFLESLPFSGCVTIVTPGGTTNSAGFASVPIPVPLVSPPITLSIQTVLLGPATCTVLPFNILVSPTWSVTFQ